MLDDDDIVFEYLTIDTSRPHRPERFEIYVDRDLLDEPTPDTEGKAPPVA